MTMERIRVPYPVIVEGKYDRLRLLSVIDAEIYTTDGFGIFKSAEKAMLLRALARKTKIIVLCDSDGAGKVIRGRISSLIPGDRLIPLYVPRIAGKEKRKREPSKEGILGVEGMERSLLLDLLRPYGEGGDFSVREKETRCVTKADLYERRLTGFDGSATARDKLAERLGLPAGMTPNAFLAALNVLCTYEEFLALTEEASDEPKEKEEIP